MKNITLLIAIGLMIVALYIISYALSWPVITEEEEPIEVEVPVVSYIAPKAKAQLPNISQTKIKNSQVFSEDAEARAKAKELGMLYVDYLHLINNNKREVEHSQPTFEHGAN